VEGRSSDWLGKKSAPQLWALTDGGMREREQEGECDGGRGIEQRQ